MQIYPPFKLKPLLISLIMANTAAIAAENRQRNSMQLP